MTENINKPLWKILNESRTQGEWLMEQPSSMNQISNDKAIVRAEIVSKNLWERVAEFDLTTLTGRTNLLGGSPKTDAQYTALCVNNMASLAASLEKILWLFGAGEIYTEKARLSFIEAKEILKAIS